MDLFLQSHTQYRHELLMMMMMMMMMQQVSYEILFLQHVAAVCMQYRTNTERKWRTLE
jgi:hypothetical protein